MRDIFEQIPNKKSITFDLSKELQRDLSHRLALARQELERCHNIATAAQFSQSPAANALALKLLDNAQIEPSQMMQHSTAAKALHKVSELEVTKQQLTAELLLPTEHQNSQNEASQQTRRPELYAYLAHQKRAESDQTHDIASRNNAKLL